MDHLLDGESIHLERKQSIIIECSSRKYIKHKKTAIKKKFLQESEITFKDKKSLQRRKQLAQNISDEICKLRLHRASPFVILKKRSVGIQSILEPLGTQAFNTSLSGVDFTIDKFSSEHKFVCTSPRYSRDEQTKCRPRMRTIGLQKNPDDEMLPKSDEEEEQQQKPAMLSTCAVDGGVEKKLALHLPLAFCGFNCGLKSQDIAVYHQNQCSQNVAYGRCCNYNHGSMCQRNKMTVKCNDCACKKRLYIQQNVPPYREYSYCCDEYYYDCPCSGATCCTRAEQTVPTIPTPPLAYCRCTQLKNAEQYTYNRRCSDLNTKEFFQAKCDTYRTTKLHKPRKEAKMMEKYMLSLLKNSRKHSKGSSQLNDDEVPKRESRATQMEQEQDGQERRNSRKQEWDSKLQQRLEKVEKVAELFEKKLKNISDDRSLSQSSEDRTSMSQYKRTSKDKPIKITHKNNAKRDSTLSADEYDGYDSSGPEYSQETLRALKRMRISQYKPNKIRDSKSEKRESINNDDMVNDKSRTAQSQPAKSARNSQQLNSNIDVIKIDNAETSLPASVSSKSDAQNADVINIENGAHFKRNSQKSRYNLDVVKIESDETSLPKSLSSKSDVVNIEKLNVGDLEEEIKERNGKAKSKYNQLPEITSKNITEDQLKKSNNARLHPENLNKQRELEQSIMNELAAQINTIENNDASSLKNKKNINDGVGSTNENNADVSKRTAVDGNESKIQTNSKQVKSPIGTNQILPQNRLTATSTQLVTSPRNSQHLTEKRNSSIEHNDELNLSTFKQNRESKEMNAKANVLYNSKKDSPDFDSKDLERILSSVSKTNSYTSNYSISSWNSCCSCSCYEDEYNPCEEETDNMAIPEFTGCPCMMDTYHQMLSIYCGNANTRDEAPPRAANRCD